MREPALDNLRDVEQLRRSGGNSRKSIAKHGAAKWAGRGDNVGSRGDQLLRAVVTDALALLLAEERESSAGATAKTPLARALGLGRTAEHRSRSTTRSSLSSRSRSHAIGNGAAAAPERSEKSPVRSGR